MKCQSCNADNRDGARFCITCGKPLVVLTECPECGKLSSSNNFCTQCGHSFNVPEQTSQVPDESSPIALAPVTTEVPETAPADPLLADADIPEKSENVAAHPSVTLDCPICGKLSSSDKFCTHCGHQFGVLLAVDSESASQVPEEPAPIVQPLPTPIAADTSAATVREAPLPATLNIVEEADKKTERIIKDSTPSSDLPATPVQPEKSTLAGIADEEGRPAKKRASSLSLVAGIIIGLGFLGTAGYLFLKRPGSDPVTQPVISSEEQQAEVKSNEPNKELVVAPAVKSMASEQVSGNQQPTPQKDEVPVPAKPQVKPAKPATPPKTEPLKSATAEPVAEPPSPSSPSAKAVPMASGQGMSTDEVYRMKAEQKCGKRPSGVFQRIPWTVCAEPVRFELCNGRWHDDNRPGEEICKNSNTQSNN